MGRSAPTVAAETPAGRLPGRITGPVVVVAAPVVVGPVVVAAGAVVVGGALVVGQVVGAMVVVVTSVVVDATVLVGAVVVGPAVVDDAVTMGWWWRQRSRAPWLVSCARPWPALGSEPIGWLWSVR